MANSGNKSKGTRSERVISAFQDLLNHYQEYTEAEKQKDFFALCDEYYKGNIDYIKLVFIAMAIFPDDAEKKLRGAIPTEYRKHEFKKMMSLNIPESTKMKLSCMYLSKARGVRKEKAA